MTSDHEKRAALVPYAVGGAALLVGLGLAALGPMAGDETAELPSPSVTASGPAPDASATASASAAPPDDVPYVPDLDGDDIGTPVTTQGVSAHGLAVVGGRIVWIETEGAKVASVPLAGGGPTTLASVDDEDRYGGGFAAASDGIFWSVGDVGGQPDPIYFVTADDLTLDAPALTPIATAASVDELALVGRDLFLADRGRLVKLDGEEQTPIAERPGRIVALVGCEGALWWLEAALAGRGEHALMTLDDDKPVRRAKLDGTDRGPMGCWSGRVVWAEDRADGTHRIVRWSNGEARHVVTTGTVTAVTAKGDWLYWTEVHGEGETAVSLLRRMRDGAPPQRIGRDGGTVTALTIADERVFWAGDDGVMAHRLP